MTLTPEQIAQGWKLHDGSDVCPIKDDRTVFSFMQSSMLEHYGGCKAQLYIWSRIRAYRIIEAHGADAEPARPTPFPASMADLVYDADGMSQAFFTGGVWPEWLPHNAYWTPFCDLQKGRTGSGMFIGELAIRVRRREPKRETVYGALLSLLNGVDLTVSFDLIDGKPDLSTLKIAEDAL